MDFKNELNREQYIAATHVQGPLLILAGAGSGKTRVITYRIAHLIENCGISPYNILAITFTNKAAREMGERAESLLNGNIAGLWINTFHAACGKILRRHAELIGFTKNFIIYDESEVNTILKDCLKKLNVDEKRLPVKGLRSIISKAKDEMLSPEKFAKTLEIKTDYINKMIAEAYKMYQNQLLSNNAMDFDDMILMTLKLFQENPDVLSYYQEKFKYIMVDEYQDTNLAQYEFVRMLASKYRNLCVVGDDDQSIYSFRGADIRNILEFENEYKDCKVIKLEQNYRSTQNILDAANNVIANNKTRRNKKLWTSQTNGEPVSRYEAEDQNDEAMFIVKTIQNGVKSGEMRYSDYTILYRINALSQSPESTLLRFGIPYRVFGGLKFFDRKEIKDIIAYLRVLDNPMDDVALKRIINVPKRGIGDTTFGYAQEIANKEHSSVFNILLNAENYPELSRVAGKMMNFALEIAEMMVKKDEMTTFEYVKYVLETTGIIDELKRENTDESESRIENLMEFLSVAKEYETDKIENADSENESSLTDFLQNIALSTDMDNKKEGEDAVILMTIHNAKGLEFPVVFVIGMEEGLFPSIRVDSDQELEEERRLCYVAITRAKKKLYLTNASERLIYGKTDRRFRSQFLSELPQECIKLENIKKKTANTTSNIRKTTDSNSYFGRVINNVQDVKKKVDASTFNIGDRVSHKKFGEGIITSLEGSGENTKVEIAFDDVGMKRLMLSYANLTHI